jgi:hypothetical protein
LGIRKEASASNFRCRSEVYKIAHLLDFIVNDKEIRPYGEVLLAVGKPYSFPCHALRLIVFVKAGV